MIFFLSKISANTTSEQWVRIAFYVAYLFLSLFSYLRLSPNSQIDKHVILVSGMSAKAVDGCSAIQQLSKPSFPF